MLLRIWMCLVVSLSLPSATHAQSNLAERYLLSAANQERAARGLSPVHWDPALAHAAQAHALRMADHRSISHKFSGEADLAERGAAAGARFSRITENVAEAPTAIIIHDAWMHSPGHRANLLDPQVDAIGVAIMMRDQQMFAVEDFAHLTLRLTLEQQEAKVATFLEAAGLTLIPLLQDARATCAAESGHQGPSRPGFIMRYSSSSLDHLPKQIEEHLSSGRYSGAAVGACTGVDASPFTGYRMAILLYQ